MLSYLCGLILMITAICIGLRIMRAIYDKIVIYLFKGVIARRRCRGIFYLYKRKKAS